MSISQRLSWTAPSVTIDASRKQIDAVVSRELCCAANECRCVAAVCCCCCLSSHGTTGGAFVKRWVAPAATIALLVLFVLNTAILAGTREYHFMLAPFYFKFDALDQSVVAELFKEKKRGGEDWNLDDILSSGESMFQDDLSVKDNIFSTYFSVLNLSEALVEAYVPENEYTMTAMVGNESVSFTVPEIHCSGAELEMLFFGKTDTGECSYDDASRACHGGFMEVKDVKAAIQCPAGFFCPDGFTCAIACAYGGTCTPSVPKANSTNKCEYAHRYEDEPAKQNDAGVCPGARYLSLCEAGYFCPNATTPGIACPVGHYCPPATQHARPCPSILYASRHLCPDEKMASPNTQRLAALLVLTSGLGLILTSRVWDALRNQLHTRMLVRMVSKVIRASEGDSIPVTLTNSELRTFSPKDNAELEKSADVLRAWQARVTRTTPRWIYDPTEDGLSASGDRGAYISSIFDADANLGDFCGCTPTVAARIAFSSSVFCFVVYVCAAFDADNGAVVMLPPVLAIGLLSCLGLIRFERLLGAVTCCFCSSAAHKLIIAGGSLLFATSLLLLIASSVGEFFFVVVLLCVLIPIWGTTGSVCLAKRGHKTQAPATRSKTEAAAPHKSQPSSPNGTLGGLDGSNDGVVHQQSPSPRLSRKDSEERRYTSVPPLNISFRGLGLVLPSGVCVLKGVTGHFDSGCVSAIMGPSGAGKTTLLNVLAGKATYGRMIGSIFLNEVEGSVKEYSPVVGFVPQDDIMIRELTVCENLEYYATMRLPPGTTTAHIRQVVDDTIEVLGLVHVQRSAIGDETTRGISGGQRKRVNVGMEMVSQPSLLFLDEPTSGLDSTTSYDLVRALQVMGRGGCNSILVLHQPSFALYSLFDRVLLLAKGGLTVYLGPADGALGYFTNKLGYTPPTDFMNPADMFMDLIAGKIRPANASSPCSEIQSPQPTPEVDQSVLRSLEGHTRIDLKLSDSDDEGGKACNAEDEAGDGRDSNEGTPLSSSDEENWNATAFLTEAWVKHKIKRQDSMHAPSSMFVKHSPEENSSPAREMASPLAMFFAFTSRAVTQFTRQPGVVAKDMMIQLLTGAFFGMVYMDARFSQLMLSTYMLTLALGLTISLASLRVYGSELVVFWREAAPGGGMALSRFAYFSAKALVELPRLALLTLCLLATFYALTSPVGSFRMYFTILYAGAFAVSGVSYIISIVLQQHSAQLAAVFITLVLFIAGGLDPTLAALKNAGSVSYAVSWLSYARWCAECIFTLETRSMTDSLKMPPLFYEQPERSSALLYLYRLSFQELFTGDSGKTFSPIEDLNLPILVTLGIGFRILAFGALCACNRDKMGKPTLVSKVSEPLLRSLDRAVNCVLKLVEKQSKKSNSPQQPSAPTSGAA